MINPRYLRPFYQYLARRGQALMRSNPNTTPSQTLNSAIKIQKTLRGFQVRKSVKEILIIKRHVDAIEKILEKDLTGLSKTIDFASLVIMICDFFKDLRLKLGSIPDFDYGVRVLRQHVNEKLIMLQESHDLEILKKSLSDSDNLMGNSNDSNKLKEKWDKKVENFEEIVDITLEQHKFDEEYDECRSVASEFWKFVENEIQISMSNLFEDSDENFGETPTKNVDCSRRNLNDWNNIQEQLDKILEKVESIKKNGDKTLEKYELNEELDDYHPVISEFFEFVYEETEELRSTLFEIIFDYMLILEFWIYFVLLVGPFSF